MRYIPDPSTLPSRPACEVKIQIPGATLPTVSHIRVPGHPPMTEAEFARLVHPVPVYIGTVRIEPAALSA